MDICIYVHMYMCTYVYMYARTGLRRAPQLEALLQILGVASRADLPLFLRVTVSGELRGSQGRGRFAHRST